MRRVNWYRTGWDYTQVVAGVAITALALDWFLIPNRIAAGGVSGIATVIFHLFGFPVGLTMLVINLPLLLLALRLLGLPFGFKTLVGAVFLSVFTDLFTGVLPVITRDPLLAAVYGGGMAGVGMGLAFRGGGSTAGTDLAAQIVRSLTRMSAGQALLIIDFAVITFAGLVFNLELALYALISLFITSKVIDLIQEGRIYAKAAYIISDHTSEIAAAILHQLERGATSWRGQGLFTGQEREILFVILNRTEVSILKDMVAAIDPDAFMVISDVHEVLGEGFAGLARK